MAAEAAAKIPERVEVLVIGAGPTGLGAASRLHMVRFSGLGCMQSHFFRH
jgi:cation diffusion facilitator CzcD-associated flavoprotein CzcO